MAKQDKDVITLARKRFDLSRDYWSEIHQQMLEDLKFSNPANPEQWDQQVQRQRESSANGARPCLTFDQTNQYIAQVVNDGRENKPAIKVRPENGDADVKVAQAEQGMVRHIEDVSRAGIAYDTALDMAARCGLGYIRLITKVVDGEMNQQEFEIRRVHDPLQVLTDPYWVEPDGSDMSYCFVGLTLIPKDDFEKKYPDASTEGWFDDDDWMTSDSVRICEYFETVEETTTMIMVQDPNSTDMMKYSEDDYHAICQNLGMTLPVSGTFKAKHKKVIWRKITGYEVLEETSFPGCYIPIFPVLGDEIYVDGKRYFSGMVRRMRDPQRAYNYERSCYIEMVSLANKSPYIAAIEAIEGHEKYWAVANTSNQALLPYNHLDAEGNPIPPPQRQQIAPVAQTFVVGAQQAIADLQASIGMYRANLGAPSNETSGKAINARQREGDQANFHYIDNLARSMAHMGRVILAGIPIIYDTKREARILGEDGQESHVTIDPNAPQAAAKGYDGRLIINPNIGKYDVTVTVGPAYASKRQEVVEMITQLTQGNPQLGAAFAPLIMKMSDMPDGDKFAKIAIATLPPPLQQAYADEDSDIPPEIKGKIQAQAKQIQDAEGVMQQLHAELQQCQAQLQSKDQEFQLKQGELQLKQQEVQIHMQELALKAKDWQHTAAKDVAATEIARYNAETQRFAAETKVSVPQPGTNNLTNATINDMMSTPGDMSTNVDTNTTINEPQ